MLTMKLIPAGLYLLLLLIFVSSLLDGVNCKKEKSGKCKQHKHCPKGTTEIYKEQDTDYDSNGDPVPVTTKYCCTKDSDKAKRAEIKAVGCQVTDCSDPSESDTPDKELCSSLNTRWVKGRKLHFEEAVRDSCTIYGGTKDGVEALCCPKNSKEGMLTLLLGAEKHQFPHYALIHAAHSEDKSSSVCGGTIYNERYIITASHCMMKNGTMHPTHGSKVSLDVRISNWDNPHTYDVEEFIVHPDSTRWLIDYNGSLYNDVGLIKLKKKIKFGPFIKALPIAKTGFNPFLYSNETVLIGVGDTDTTLIANMLQRVRTFLRSDKKNMRNKPEEQADAILFVGGIQDGVTSARSGPGDSGGPAICRDEMGYAILCGLDSSGPNLAKCEKELTEHACRPLNYMEVQHYYDWFVSVAGDQSKAEVLKAPLFGAPVPAKQYEHQVRITTKDGPSCGGTLIEKNVVVTAAHCVVDGDGNSKSDVKVFTGIRDLNSDQGTKIDVAEVIVLDGYQLGNQGTRSRRIAMMNVKPTPKYPYYKNDLALLKLKSKADISSKKLPKVGPAPMSGGDEDNVIWTTEVSLPTDTSKSGALQQRDFHILDHQSCQKRMKRASYAGYDVKVDENIMCGEEMYAGGAQCDRELGGGLICKGDDGMDVLCGVQVFRFCQLALPSAFLDINKYKGWIEKTKSPT